MTLLGGARRHGAHPALDGSQRDETQEPEINAAITAVAGSLDQLELRSLFTGEHDDSDCIVQINAKDGGVDAQDFSEMLLRMYERWCERRGFAITLMEFSDANASNISFD